MSPERDWAGQAALRVRLQVHHKHVQAFLALCVLACQRGSVCLHGQREALTPPHPPRLRPKMPPPPTPLTQQRACLLPWCRPVPRRMHACMPHAPGPCHGSPRAASASAGWHGLRARPGSTQQAAARVTCARNTRVVCAPQHSTAGRVIPAGLGHSHRSRQLQDKRQCADARAAQPQLAGGGAAPFWSVSREAT